MNEKTTSRLSTVFVWSILVVVALVFLAWASSAFFGSTDGATDWRGLIPAAMAAAIPCGLLAAAIFIPLSRRRYRRESKRRIDAARATLAGRAMKRTLAFLFATLLATQSSSESAPPAVESHAESAKVAEPKPRTEVFRLENAIATLSVEQLDRIVTDKGVTLQDGWIRADDRINALFITLPESDVDTVRAAVRELEVAWTPILCPILAVESDKETPDWTIFEKETEQLPERGSSEAGYRILLGGVMSLLPGKEASWSTYQGVPKNREAFGRSHFIVNVELTRTASDSVVVKARLERFPFLCASEPSETAESTRTILQHRFAFLAALTMENGKQIAFFLNPNVIQIPTDDEVPFPAPIADFASKFELL